MHNVGTRILYIGLICVSLLFLIKCKNSDPKVLTDLELKLDQVDPQLKPFDSTAISSFFVKYPELAVYKMEVLESYRNHDFNYLWHDSKGRKKQLTFFIIV